MCRPSWRAELWMYRAVCRRTAVGGCVVVYWMYCGDTRCSTQFIINDLRLARRLHRGACDRASTIARVVIIARRRQANTLRRSRSRAKARVCQSDTHRAALPHEDYRTATTRRSREPCPIWKEIIVHVQRHRLITSPPHEACAIMDTKRCRYNTL